MNITVKPRIEFYLQVSGGNMVGSIRGIWVTCVSCGTMSELRIDGLRPDNDEIDRISDADARRHFAAAGWRVGPTYGPTSCPPCLGYIWPYHRAD